MKKLFTSFLAILLVMSLEIGAFAAEVPDVKNVYSETSAVNYTYGNNTGITTYASDANGVYDITAKVGESIQLTNYASTIYMSHYAYTWFSSDGSVVSVPMGTNSRVITATALKAGTSTVTAYLDGEIPKINYGTRYNSITKKFETYTWTTYTHMSYKYVYNITVTGSGTVAPPPSTDTGSGSDKEGDSGVFHGSYSITMKTGESLKLSDYTDCCSKKLFFCGSDNTSVVSTSGDKVTAKKAGTATVELDVACADHNNFGEYIYKITVTDSAEENQPSNPGSKSYDLNGDGVVNITDAIELLKNIAGLDNNVLAGANADIDGNGTVNINDAIALLKRIAGLK